MAPFLVLLPVASAVPAAAESVTPFVAEKVVDTGELCELQRDDSDFSVQFSPVEFCPLYLVNTHTVSDEIEDILGLLGK